jgi:hypothetical protein
MFRAWKQYLVHAPVVGDALWRWGRKLRPSRPEFAGTRDFWESRYRRGGDSGVGSYGKFAQFKAEVLNRLVRQHDIRSVIEFGCGDGHQASLAEYPRYAGYDISVSAIERCRRLFQHDATKRFMLVEQYAGETADLAISLDVLFHLVEEDLFADYLRRLFQAAERYVVIYSSNGEVDEKSAAAASAHHVRHRRFTDWVDQRVAGWRLRERIPNRYPYRGNSLRGSFSDFYIYEREPPELSQVPAATRSG